MAGPALPVAFIASIVQRLPIVSLSLVADNE